MVARAKQQTPVDEVEVARDVLARARVALKREEERLGEARREVGRADEKVREADPDVAAFARMVATRDAAKGRVAALEEREEAARAMVERSSQAVTAAERAQKKIHLAELDAQLRELDAAITRDVLEAYERLLRRIRDARRLAAEANAIEGSTDASRGSRWAQSPLNKGALRWAVGALPDRVAGEEAPW